MKKFKQILLAVIVIAIAAAGYGFYMYKKKPADVRKLSANYELTAVALLADYNKDETAANVKYLDKVIAVQGKVVEVKLDTASGQATVILETGDPLANITCSFYDNETAAVKNLSPGTAIVVKGKCTGKLMDVVLNKCSIGKKS